MRRVRLLIGFLIIFLLGLVTSPGLWLTYQLARVFIPGKLEITELSGQLIHRIHFEELNYENDAFKITLQQGDLNWNLVKLFKKKLLIENLAINLILFNSKTSAVNNTNLSSTLRNLPVEVLVQQAKIAHFQIIEELVLLNTQFSLWLKQNQWKITSFHTQYQTYQIVFDANLSPIFPYPLTSTITVSSNLLPARGNFYLKGDFSHYSFQGQLDSILKIQADLYQAKQLIAEITWKELSWPALFESDTGSLRIKGSYPNFIIQMKTHTKSPADLSFSATADTFKQGLQTHVTVTSPYGEANLLASYWTLANPRLQGHLQAQANLEKNKIILTNDFKGNNLDNLVANGIVSGTYNHHPLKGNLKFIQQKLEVFLQLGNNKINITGSLDKAWQFKADLLNSSLLHPMLEDMTLPIHLEGQINPDQSWRLTGNTLLDKQTLQLNGQGNLSPEIKGTLSLNGENLSLIHTNEYEIFVSPQLSLEFTPTLLKMKGTILIPHAFIKLKTFTESVKLTDDAILTDSQPTQGTAFPLDTEVTLTMGDDVKLAVMGLEGSLVGSVKIIQQSPAPMLATGQLTIRDGQYKAYGQNLKISQGELLFTGGLIDNPGINLRASKQFNNASIFATSNQLLDFNTNNLQAASYGTKTTVGINVSGHLSNPKVQLFSSPPTLSQADILSLLILGKPANQANKAGAQLLLTAISTMHLQNQSTGIQLLSQLKRSLGVDFNLENNSQYDQKKNQITDKSTFVIGKALSSRLYASYNMGLSQKDNNVLTLKYLLNKFLSVQVNTSSNGSGLDLFYTRQIPSQ